MRTGRAPASGRPIAAEQLSHAIAERYGLDHLDLEVFKVGMSAAPRTSQG